jgi:hypothetical protein
MIVAVREYKPARAIRRLGVTIFSGRIGFSPSEDGSLGRFSFGLHTSEENGDWLPALDSASNA